MLVAPLSEPAFLVFIVSYIIVSSFVLSFFLPALAVRFLAPGLLRKIECPVWDSPPPQ
jgi:hypothetical protein